ncbi:ribosomal RNA small subunit methyltransferase E [Bryobacterales bacterium F-183]|nr:ribosomal RNA small subunit methyltransferase E [Bryobacterales bacterium F-183]
MLRVEKGERYEISDNSNVYLAEVSLAHKGEVVFEVVEELPLKPKIVPVTLVVALFKFDHLEWLIEKATELGVACILPVIAIRSERGLDQAAPKRIERWRRIGLEASQQSRRDVLPEIELPIKFAELLKRQAALRLLLDETAGPEHAMLRSLPDVLPEDVLVALGPEGGWTDGEREQFILAGWKAVSLGSQILRAETAGIAALAILQAGLLGK